MRKTDYSKIARCYDKGIYRRETEVDHELLKILACSAETEFRVLDIGCGTANYLSVQELAFRNCQVEWHGIDLSTEMLSIANSKTQAILTQGRAEHLPFRSNTYDYIVLNFSFHHFVDKRSSVNEIVRVMKNKSVVRMFSIEPSQSEKWWIYQMFPGTLDADLERFWTLSEIESAFRAYDIEISIKLRQFSRDLPITVLYESAKNRDISELANMEDTAYLSNLGKLEYRCRENPDFIFRDELTLIECIGQRGPQS